MILLVTAGLAPAVWLAFYCLGRHMRRAHDAKYFPPAVLRPVLTAKKDAAK